jgi:MFS family permease
VTGISRRYAYFVFSLLFLLYMFDYASRLVVVSLFPVFEETYGWSKTQCGLLQSVVYWSIIVFTFPASILIDRWSRRKAIGVMAGMWSLATAACGLGANFTHLVAARTMVGIGEAGYAPGGTAMISALFPEKKRAAVMGIWNASIPLGSAIGIALGGVIAHHFGWRYSFWFVAIPGFVVAMLFFTVKDYRTIDLVKTKTAPADGVADGVDVAPHKMKFKEIVHEFLRAKSLILTYVAFAGMTFVTTSLMTWLPSYFYEISDKQMDLQDASIKAAAVMVLAIVGAPLGGYLTDRWQRKRRNARPVFAGLAALLTSALLFIAFFLTEGNVQYAFLLLGGASVVAFLPAAAAVTQDVIHPGLRATSYAVCVVVQNLLGSSLGPLYVGAASDKWEAALIPQVGEVAANKLGLTYTLSTLPAFTLVAGILFLIAAIYYERDLDMVERVEIQFED